MHEVGQGEANESVKGLRNREVEEEEEEVVDEDEVLEEEEGVAVSEQQVAPAGRDDATATPSQTGGAARKS